MARPRLRIHADKSSGRRVVMFDPQTGARKLVNPDTPGEAHEPWPRKGVTLDLAGEDTLRLSTDLVQRGVSEGWITGEGAQTVIRPGGPPEDPDRVDPVFGIPHVFRHFEALVIHTLEGDVRFRVTHQPDKYAAEGNDKTKVTKEMYAAGATRVDWFYDMEVEK